MKLFKNHKTNRKEDESLNKQITALEASDQKKYSKKMSFSEENSNKTKQIWMFKVRNLEKKFLLFATEYNFKNPYDSKNVLKGRFIQIILSCIFRCCYKMCFRIDFIKLSTNAFLF